jgi:Ca-activated chloride channel family protein
MKLLAAAAVCAFVAPIVASRASRQSAPVFRSTGDTVAVYATVSDEHGRPVTGLQQTDFEIRDNGARRPITAFSSGTQAMTVGILLDRSGSVASRDQDVTTAARAFIEGMRPDDRASLASLTWACEPLTTKDRLLAALDRLWPGDAGSPIWIAIDRTLTSLERQAGRRAMLVMTDGEDNGAPFGPPPAASPSPSSPSPCTFVSPSVELWPAQVGAHARQDGTLVYAVSVDNGHLTDDSALRQIAKDSGGAAYTLKSTTDLARTFRRVADELHQQYLLGFVPTAWDGMVHAIDVRVTRGGATVRARKSYVAARTIATGPDADAQAFAGRPLWPVLTDGEVEQAIREGVAGRTLEAACSAAAVFADPLETSTSIRVVARGPAGRLMRIAGPDLHMFQPLTHSQVAPAARAPTLQIEAAAQIDGRAVNCGPGGRTVCPEPLRSIELRGRGASPIVLTPIESTVITPADGQILLDGLFASYAMTDIKGLAGNEIEAKITSKASDRACRFARADIAAIR